MTKRTISLLAVLLCAVYQSLGQSNPSFIENIGQWENQVVYKAIVPSGSMFLEKQGFTYNFFDGAAISSIHGSGKRGEFPETLNCHAFKVLFKGSRKSPALLGTDQLEGTNNFFIGDDPDKWASGANAFSGVTYAGIYPKTNLLLYGSAGSLKYDFVLEAGADPSDIIMEYEGLENIYIDRGNLYLITTVNTLVENAPYAYQEVGGVKVEVPCEFVLRENRVKFDFPKGYDRSFPLVIDPKIVFASYSGSAQDNWGSTATYDNDGNLYGGSIVFGVGYPTTTGAYQVSFAGGTPPNNPVHPGFDVAISKFNPIGTGLIYSTYLGGNSNEFAHSIIVDNNDELIVYGTTGSDNFPTTASAFQSGFNGGSPIVGPGGYIRFPNGVDMFVSRLSSDGTSLSASTYVGGTENDGQNHSPDLDYNYGDTYRGDITVDASNNCYVASTTQSPDFPVTGSVFQSVHGGKQDACVFKLNSSFTGMVFSTYLGSTDDDAAYSIELNGAGDVLVCGGTSSSGFPVTSGVHDETFNGDVDGFVAKISASGNTLLGSSFLGTSDYDQAYILDLDGSGNVYLFGQCEGNYPVTTGAYSNPNSSQFLHKLNSNLDATIFSTVIGSTRGAVDISPTALLVSDCNHIYISGWGGEINQTNSQAANSSTSGLAITADAYQNGTDGSDFYFAVFSSNATELIYGTFFGGRNSAEHVDGGTSRFDRKGNIYQAICAGCGGNHDLPTTEGAWSTVNGSPNCNLGVVKFDLAELTAQISKQDPYVCYPLPFQFTNISNGGTSYLWDFGDGNYSTEREPLHLYGDTGIYYASLSIFDSLTCKKTDFDSVKIEVLNPPSVELVNAPTYVCRGSSVTLTATAGFYDYTWTTLRTGETFEWPAGVIVTDSVLDRISEALGLDQNEITVSPSVNTTYIVQATDSLGCSSSSSSAVAAIDVIPLPTVSAGADINISWLNDEAQLRANVGKYSFFWHEDSTLSCTLCPNPIASPSTTTDYVLEVLGELGCKNYDTVRVAVDGSIYVPNAFTPNNDGRNDVFYVYGKELEKVHLTIFNRWGEQIFFSPLQEEGWDGTFKGNPAKFDTYVWRVIAEEYTGKEYSLMGHVTLVR